MTEKLVAIGDVHGRHDLLQSLLERIVRAGWGSHLLVFLGDMVDRGPDSFKVVQTVKDLEEAGKAKVILGNHETFMLDYVTRMIFDPQNAWFWPGNGGKKTVLSYTKEMKMYGQGNFFKAIAQSGHLQWLRKQPMFFETEKAWFSHAPVPVRKYRRFDDPRDDVDALTWSYHGRYDGETEASYAMDHGKLAVCGHIHALQEGVMVPRVYPHIVYLDTGSGCMDRAPLSAMLIEDGKPGPVIQAWPHELKSVPPQEPEKRESVGAWEPQDA